MTIRSKFGYLALVAATCLVFTGVQAGGYVGAAAGQGTTEISDPTGGSAFDSSGTSYKLHGGYRVMKFFGVEADYRSFGAPTEMIGGTEYEVDTTAFDLFAVGVIPVASAFELFGKAGYSAWDADFNIAGVTAGNDDGGDLAYGLGAAYKMGRFALRVEWEQFEIENTDNMTMATLGFDFRF